MPSQVFTTTNNLVWNWPAGVTQVTVECLGGGGGGGMASGSPATGGGGKGGQYARRTVTKGAEASLDLRPGPADGPSFVQQGGVDVCRALGGGTGGHGTANSTNGAGATIQTTGTAMGDVIFNGGNGGTGNFTSGVGGSGAGGGAAGPTSAGVAASGNTPGSPGTGTWLNGLTYQGFGAAGVGNNTAGAAGIAYGGGGSGGKANTTADRLPGAGAQGIIVFTWASPGPPPQYFSTII